eukprot:755033-Hanusia_phi.AAC.1
MAIMNTEETLESSHKDTFIHNSTIMMENEEPEGRYSLLELKGWFEDKEVTQQLDEELRTAIDMEDVTTDKVTKSLEQARLLKTSLQQISDSLITTAHADHKVLRKKLSEQYFTFNAQVNRLVGSLEQQEKNNKRLMMMTLVLKEKLKFREEQLWRAIDQEAVERRRRQGTDIEDKLQSVRDAPTAAQAEQLEWELAKTKTKLRELEVLVEEKEKEKEKLKKQLSEALLALAKQSAEADQAFLAEMEALRGVLVAARKALDVPTFVYLDDDNDKVEQPLQRVPREIAQLHRQVEDLKSEKSRVEEQSKQETERLREFLAALESKVKFQSKQIQTLKSSQSKLSGNVFQQTMQALKTNTKPQAAGAKPPRERLLSSQQETSPAVESPRSYDSSNTAEALEVGTNQDKSSSEVSETLSSVPEKDPQHADSEPRKQEHQMWVTRPQVQSLCLRVQDVHKTLLSSFQADVTEGLPKPPALDDSDSFDDVGTFLEQTLADILSHVSKFWQQRGMATVRDSVREVNEQTVRRVSETFAHLSEMKSLKDLMALVDKDEREEGKVHVQKAREEDEEKGGGVEEEREKESEMGGDKRSESARKKPEPSDPRPPRKLAAQKLEDRWKLKMQMWEAKKEEIRRKRAEAIARCMGAFAIAVEPLSPAAKEHRTSAEQDEKRTGRSEQADVGAKRFNLKTFDFSHWEATSATDAPRDKLGQCAHVAVMTLMVRAKFLRRRQQ